MPCSAPSPACWARCGGGCVATLRRKPDLKRVPPSPSTQDSTSSSTARDAITTQVGLAKYFTRLAALRTLPALSPGAGALAGELMVLLRRPGVERVAGSGAGRRDGRARRRPPPPTLFDLQPAPSSSSPLLSTHTLSFSDTVTPPTAAVDDHLRAFIAGFEALFQARLMSGGAGPSPTQPAAPPPPPQASAPPPAPAPVFAAPAAQAPPEDVAAFFEATGGGGAAPTPPPPPAFGNCGPPPVTATGHVDVVALQRKFGDVSGRVWPLFPLLHPRKLMARHLAID